MTWLRLDDMFAEHEKVADLSDRAFRLHVVALCYCARHLTDGFLDDRAVRVCCAIVTHTSMRRYVTELVNADLWMPEQAGYQIRDFLDYNPDSDTVKARREARKEAGKAGARARWGDSKSHSKSHSSPDVPRDMPPGPYPDPEVKPDRPVEEISQEGQGQLHSLEARAAAERLLAAIRPEHMDSGTRTVILGYAQELAPADFMSVQRELEKHREEIRNEGRWANGALQKRAIKRAAGRDAA